MRTAKKMVTIYTKNGNTVQIDENMKSAFVGKGYYTSNPAEKLPKGVKDGK